MSLEDRRNNEDKFGRRAVSGLRLSDGGISARDGNEININSKEDWGWDRMPYENSGSW